MSNPKPLTLEHLRGVLEKDSGYWMFDLDGTLIDLAARPDGIDVPTPLLRDLTSLMNLQGGRVALISGRALIDLKAQIPIPTLTLVGNHGGEWRLDGQEWTVDLSDQTRACMQRVRARLHTLQHRFSPQLLIEDKRISLSVHVRHLTAPEKSQCERALREIIDPRDPLELRPAEECWEIRPRFGPNKGDAVRQLLSHRTTAVIPIVFGDDWTDEDAFVAANPNGITVIVGDRHPTQARFGLPSPAALRTLLHQIVQSLQA